jgi:hypothetical protein
MFCCFTTQSTSDDEREPLLGQAGSNNSNSDSQAVQHFPRFSVNQDQHGGSAIDYQQENEESRARSVKQVNQGTQTNPVQIVSEELSSQTGLIQQVDQVSQTSSVEDVTDQFSTTPMKQETIENIAEELHKLDELVEISILYHSGKINKVVYHVINLYYKMS